MKVYLVTSGDGSDGDNWQLHGIFTSTEKAEAFKTSLPSFYNPNPIEAGETDPEPLKPGETIPSF